MYDTIIIGAGLSGLAAGIRLAYYDKRVCVLERHYNDWRFEFVLSPAWARL